MVLIGIILLALAAGVIYLAFRTTLPIFVVGAIVLVGFGLWLLGVDDWLWITVLGLALVALIFLLWYTLPILGLVIIAVVLILALFAGQALYQVIDDDKDKSGEVAQPERHPRKGGDTTASTPSTTNPPKADDIAVQINQIFVGYNPGELVIGTKNVTFDGAPEERGTAAFSQRTLKTPQEVGEFLRENTDVSKAARQRVEESIRKAGYGDDEVKRALDGTGYFPIQAKVASQVLGTTYFKDGKVLEASQWRQVGENDVFWLFMAKDRKIIFGATIRADCANPNITKVVPVRLTTPKVPPIEIPPGEKCPFNPKLPVDSPDCLKPKNPAEDINENPKIPDQVRKTQPSPDNQTEIGQGAQKPQDTATGCVGPCPVATSSTTTTTLPQGTGGSTSTTVPGCGHVGQPACNNTGETAPTTTTQPTRQCHPNSPPGQCLPTENETPITLP